MNASTVIGLFMLWFIGLFIFPVISMVVYGYWTGWEDGSDEVIKLSTLVGFVLYLVATAIFLILL